MLGVLVAAMVGAVLPTAASADAAGRPVYVVNSGDQQQASSLAQFTIGSNGALQPLSPASLDPGFKTAYGLVITPDGRHVYVSDVFTGDVYPFDAGPDGRLALASSGPIPSGASGVSGMAISPDGTRLYVLELGGPAGNVFTFDVARDGSLSRHTPYETSTEGVAPTSIALSPDGRYAYVANGITQDIAQFRIDGDGTLQPQSPATVDVSPHLPGAMAVTPNGRFLYATANEFNGSVMPFRIASDGTLERGQPPVVVTGNENPVFPTVSPDGRSLYTNGFFDNRYAMFTIDQATGGLTPKSPAFAAAEAYPEQLAFTADGKWAYGALTERGLFEASVAMYSADADGVLSPMSPAEVPSSGQEAQTVVIQPDQGPVARFTAPASAQTGQAVSFDGSGSGDPDGTIARYEWDFGDGTKAADGGPTPSHTYGAPGTYTVTLKVVDDEGCSDRRTYTGTVVTCNGGPAAVAAHQVTVTGPAQPVTPAPPPPSIVPSTPSTPLTPPIRPASFARVRILTHRVNVAVGAAGAAGRARTAARVGAVAIRLRCVARGTSRCRGRLALPPRLGRSVAFSIPAGRTRTVTTTLRPRGLRALRRNGRLAVRVTATTRQPGRRAVASSSRRVVLRAVTGALRIRVTG